MKRPSGVKSAWFTPSQLTANLFTTAWYLSVAEIDAFFPFCHDNRVFTVGREVHVVRVIHMDGLPILPVAGSNMVSWSPEILSDPETFKIP